MKPDQAIAKCIDIVEKAADCHPDQATVYLLGDLANAMRELFSDQETVDRLVEKAQPKRGAKQALLKSERKS